MGTKMRVFSKGVNKYITQMFVIKEEDDVFQIGSPTDVKHVAHIGWDGNSGSCPTWMENFDTGPEFASSSMGASASAASQWSCPDMECKGQESTTQEDVVEDAVSTDLPTKPKKHRRKKKPSSSTSSSIDGVVKPKRKPRSKLIESKSSPLNIEVS